MNILILGNAMDAHAVHMHHALIEAGAVVDYWDTRLFPIALTLSWQPEIQQGTVLLPSGQRFALRDIHSVYWRSLTGVQIPPMPDERQYQIALNDATSVLRSLIKACPAHWVNSWEAYEFHQEKPLQLSKAHQLGATIPATLISNDPAAIQEFVQTHNSVVFKPVYGGAHTQFVTAAHLEPQRLSVALQRSPVTLQAYIAGTNIRTYVIGDRLFTAEIRTEAIDFREDVQAQLLPLGLPREIEQLSLAIARSFGLEWTAIDWRRTPMGEYVFLEANPSPMFIYFEQQTGYPITQALVELLMA